MKRGLIPLLLLSLLALSCSRGQRSAELVVRDFSFPWADKQAPGTEFRAHTADHRLHFQFVAEDAEVIISDKWEGESTLDREDRVELFIAKDESLKDYWCLEIDPLGRVHDYHARHYRRFDNSWNCPGLAVTGTRTPTGYEVTGSISLSTLSELLGHEVRSGTVLRVGLFRAEFYGKTGGGARDNWISWIRPNSQEPDFHIPSAFREWTIP